MTEAKKLFSAIKNSNRKELSRVEVKENGALVIGFELDDQELVASFSGVHITQVEPRQHAHRGRPRGRRDPTTLSVDELRKRHLPLYWNREWLEQQLDELGSYAEIARKHGFPSPTTIASYANRKFGFSIQDEFDRKRAAVVAEYRESEGAISKKDLAERHGVAVATIYRWLAEESRRDQEGPPKRGRPPGKA